MGQQPLQRSCFVVSAILCCLHNTRLQPSYMAPNIGPTDAIPRHVRRCTHSCCSVHLLSFCDDGSTNSFVKRDHEEVCPLSRQITLKPVSAPLQCGIRFFLFPLPAPPLADFAVCCPRGERYEVPTFHLLKYAGLGACSGPGGVWVTRTQWQSAAPTSVTFWFKRDSHFRLFRVTIFIADSNIFTNTSYLALIRHVAARRVCLSRLIPRTLPCFVSLSEPLLIQVPRFIR